jgi:hypothetical protein
MIALDWVNFSSNLQLKFQIKQIHLDTCNFLTNIINLPYTWKKI